MMNSFEEFFIVGDIKKIVFSDKASERSVLEINEPTAVFGRGCVISSSFAEALNNNSLVKKLEKSALSEELFNSDFDPKTLEKNIISDMRIASDTQLIYLHAVIHASIYKTTIKVYNSVLYDNAQKNMFDVRDGVSVFSRCVFKSDNTLVKAINVFGESICVCDACFFDGCSINIFNGAVAQINNSSITGAKGRAITISGESSLFLSKSTINNFSGDKRLISVDKGSALEMSGVTIKDNTHGLHISAGTLICNDCCFSSIVGTAIIARNYSTIHVSGCAFADVEGNGVMCENTTGFLNNCAFARMQHPSIITRGAKCNPIISNCKFAGNNAVCYIAARHCSRPYVLKCAFGTCDTYCIHCADFSMPVIDACTFNPAQNSKNIAIYDYARTLLIKTSLSKAYLIKHGRIFNDINECEGFGRLVLRTNTIKTPLGNIVNKIVDVQKSVLDNKALLKKCLSFVDVKKMRVSAECEKIDFICLPCGHPISNDKTCGKCAICDSAIYKTVKVYTPESNVLCAICESNCINTVITPCGHSCLCAGCALKYLDSFFTCPICRSLIQHIKVTTT